MISFTRWMDIFWNIEDEILLGGGGWCLDNQRFLGWSWRRSKNRSSICWSWGCCPCSGSATRRLGRGRTTRNSRITLTSSNGKLILRIIINESKNMQVQSENVSSLKTPHSFWPFLLSVFSLHFNLHWVSLHQRLITSILTWLSGVNWWRDYVFVKRSLN